MNKILTRRAFAQAAVLTGALAAYCATATRARAAADPTNDHADVVVVGSGGAGMTCAIKACEAGLNVVVLEKEDVVGGSTKIATTNFTAANARVQEEAGVEGATPDAFYEKFLPEATVPEAMRIMADESGAAADFLTDIGMDLSRCWSTFNCGTSDGSPVGFPEVCALEARMQELGVDCRLGHLATKIVRDEDGTVTGLEVDGPDGPYAIDAAAVVLASGGFAANPQMVAKYDPRWEGLSFTCGHQATGEGTLMAIEAGAAVSNMDNTKVNPTGYYLTDTTVISMAPVRVNGGIMVATNDSAENSGRRIVNEEGGYTPNSQVIMENGGSTYMVFDQTLVDHVAAVAGFKESGYLTEAPTLEELADAIEVDKEAFLATCADWAECVAKGEDPDFGKKNFVTDLTNAPFYAIRVKPAVQGTYGGVTTQYDTTEVLDEAGAVIPGLFACGECADEGVGVSSPTTVNVVFGTRAAQAVADYLA